MLSDVGEECWSCGYNSDAEGEGDTYTDVVQEMALLAFLWERVWVAVEDRRLVAYDPANLDPCFAANGDFEVVNLSRIEAQIGSLKAVPPVRRRQVSNIDAKVLVVQVRVEGNAKKGVLDVLVVRTNAMIYARRH